MRKSILFGLAILSLAAVSCSREMEAPVAKSDANIVTLGASLADTKAAISDAGAFTWQEGDAMSVATDGGFVKFTLSAGAGSASADFSAVLNASAKLGELAVYPAGAHALAGNSLTVNLPAEYVYEEANTNVPLLGAVSGNAVAMRYIGGVVRFPVSKMPVGAAKVVLSADKKISGEFALDLSTADAVLLAGEGASSITYSFSEIKDLMVFNFPLPAGEYNLKLQILDAEGAPLFEKEGAAPSTIAAGSVLVYNELSVQLPGVVMNGKGYESVAAAIEAAQALTDGTAEIIFNDDVEEDIYIAGQFAAAEGQTARTVADGEKVVKVPVVINGNGKTLKGSIEILTAPVTIKDLTIKPQAHHTVYAESRQPDYAYGIFVHYAQYGVVVDNVTIDMAEAEANATCLFMYNGVASNDDDGPTRDIIKNSSFIGNTTTGNRLVQFYQSKADFLGNDFQYSYSGYAVRIDGWGANILLNGNSFTNPVGTKAVFDFKASLSHGAVTLGDGEVDNNTYEGFQWWGNAAFDITSGASMTYAPELEYIEGGEVRIKPQVVNRIWKKTNAEIPLVSNGFKGGQVAFSGVDFVLNDLNVYNLDGNKIGVLNTEGVPANFAVEGMSNSYDGYLVISFVWNNVTGQAPASIEEAYAYGTYVWFDGWDKAPTIIWGDPASTAETTSGNSGYGLAVSGYMAQGGTWVLSTNQSADNDTGRNCHTIVWPNYDHATPHMSQKPDGSWAWNTIPYQLTGGDKTGMMQAVTGTADGKWVYYASIANSDALGGGITVGVRQGRKSGADCGADDIMLSGLGKNLHPWYPDKFWGNLNSGHVRGFLYGGKEYVVVMSNAWIGCVITVLACDDTASYLKPTMLFGPVSAAACVSSATVEDNGVIHIIARASAGGAGEIRRYDIGAGASGTTGSVEGPDVTVTPGVKF